MMASRTTSCQAQQVVNRGTPAGKRDSGAKAPGGRKILQAKQILKADDTDVTRKGRGC